MPPNLHALINTLLPLAIIAFVVYRRIRRTIGRQRLQPRRLMVRVGLLAAVTIWIFAVQPPALMVFAGAGAGLVLGAGLGVYALRHTRFDVTSEGTTYIGHPYIGLAVSLLLVGRVLYRVLQMSAAVTAARTAGPHDPAQALAASMSNPLTAGTFCVMVGYYVVYYIGLLRHRPQAVPTTPPDP